MTKEFPGGQVLELIEGDITKIAADVIVNAANSALAGGGGVDGAIHRAGGPSIMQELRRYDGCPTGTAVATGAGALPAKFVFHTVGPVWRGGARYEADLLASCYWTCLQMAEERELKTIAFPAISTGIYRYPMEAAARIAIDSIYAHFANPGTHLRQATFVLFGGIAFEAFKNALGFDSSTVLVVK